MHSDAANLVMSGKSLSTGDLSAHFRKVIPIEVKVEDQAFFEKFGLPTYGHPDDAGFDLRANLNPFGTEAVVLMPNQTIKIGCGFAFYVANPDWYLMVAPRSGKGHNQGLILSNTVGVIDPSFQGETQICLWNRGTSPIRIEHGEKVAQGILQHKVSADFKVVDNFSTGSCRGANGFNSTGSI